MSPETRVPVHRLHIAVDPESLWLLGLFALKPDMMFRIISLSVQHSTSSTAGGILWGLAYWESGGSDRGRDARRGGGFAFFLYIYRTWGGVISTVGRHQRLLSEASGGRFCLAIVPYSYDS